MNAAVARLARGAGSTPQAVSQRGGVDGAARDELASGGQALRWVAVGVATAEGTFRARLSADESVAIARALDRMVPNRPLRACRGNRLDGGHGTTCSCYCDLSTRM